MKQKYRLKIFKGENGTRQYLGKAKLKCNKDTVELIKLALADIGLDVQFFGEPEGLRNHVARLSKM